MPRRQCPLDAREYRSHLLEKVEGKRRRLHELAAFDQDRVAELNA